MPDSHFCPSPKELSPYGFKKIDRFQNPLRCCGFIRPSLYFSASFSGPTTLHTRPDFCRHALPLPSPYAPQPRIPNLKLALHTPRSFSLLFLRSFCQPFLVYKPFLLYKTETVRRGLFLVACLCCFCCDTPGCAIPLTTQTPAVFGLSLNFLLSFEPATAKFAPNLFSTFSIFFFSISQFSSIFSFFTLTP